MDANDLPVRAIAASHQRAGRRRSIRHSVQLLLPPRLDHSTEKFRRSSGQFFF